MEQAETTELSRPPLALSLGDPCGIGPELIVQAAQQGALHDVVVHGSRAVLERAARVLGLAALPPLTLLEPAGLPEGLAGLPWGQVHAHAGAAAALCVRSAAAACLAGQARAMVTAPLHKEALAAAGEPFPGHTELLQAMAAPAGAPLPPVRMMLANEELRVVLVTIHMALREAIEALSFEAVLQTLHITDAALKRMLGMAAPRIAVAGLNPHAGEGGRFGSEEQAFIGPAVQAAIAQGVRASGPYAPDTVFMRARRGEFDAVVAMTHDHGLIPVKYLGVEQGVNTTLGLPFVRTSPDHGTAFDIAGLGRADVRSLLAALQAARRLSATHPAAKA
jgi:4-hydroxythreonine-4-phosphate dehydrogenase